MIPELPDGRLHAVRKDAPRFGIGIQAFVAPLLKVQRRKHRVPHIAVHAVVDHVLKDDHAEPVAVVIEPVRLDLDMLAQRVEAERFHGKDVLLKPFGRRGRIQSVAPVTLIQKSVEDIRLAVQTQARDAADRLDRKRAQRKIGLHRIRAA